MEISVELFQINRTPRPNGELVYTATFVLPFVPIIKTSEKHPAEARIVVSQGTPQIALPYEVKFVMHFTDEEWKNVSNKLVVGKEYALKFDKNRIVVEL